MDYIRDVDELSASGALLCLIECGVTDVIRLRYLPDYGGSKAWLGYIELDGEPGSVLYCIMASDNRPWVRQWTGDVWVTLHPKDNEGRP